MSQSRGGRAHRERRPSPCRAWAGSLDDEAVAELRQRVADDAVVDVAFLLAHASEWEDTTRPALDQVERTTP